MTALRVLHVDDESDIREIVEISLALDSDFETRGCGSGRDALAVAVDWQPHLILLDVMMPVMDGPATLARLRDNARTAKIPVVFMTARAQTQELDLFRSLGAAGVIPKPFDPMTLAASVRKYVGPVEDPLAAARDGFLRRVSQDADTLIECWSAKGFNTPAVLTRIKDIAHRLAGAAGIFGFAQIGNAAAVLEEAGIIQLNGAGMLRDVERALERLITCLETNRSNRVERPRRWFDA